MLFTQSHLCTVFTFQYVSIKTLFSHLLHLPRLYLHSNMFLLRPRLTNSAWLAIVYLHSNMFLLRHKSVRSCAVKYLAFTFQYVSIKTTLEIDRIAVANGFTFQYVSIKTLYHRPHRCPRPDLHSNMFLLRRF